MEEGAPETCLKRFTKWRAVERYSPPDFQWQARVDEAQVVTEGKHDGEASQCKEKGEHWGEFKRSPLDLAGHHFHVDSIKTEDCQQVDCLRQQRCETVSLCQTATLVRLHPLQQPDLRQMFQVIDF